MGNSVSALMDGVLLLANANQELNYRRRELMRPQLNTNYRRLCSPSNPVTAELFGDDLLKAVKGITDTNRLKWSGFDSWPRSLCCILRQDTLLSQYSSSPRCTNGYQQICWGNPIQGGVAILLGASC